ncbi:AAA family ATPase [Ursidibacter sp. B-7004-1]
MSQYQVKPIVTLYAESLMLEILCEHNYMKKMLDDWRDENIRNGLGLPEELQSREPEDQDIIKELLTGRWASIQSQTIENSVQFETAYRNLNKLAQIIGLNENEKAVFRLALHLRAESPLKEIFEYLPKKDLNATVDFFSTLLKIPRKTLFPILSKKGKLLSYGVLERSHYPDRVNEFIQWGDTLDFDDFMVVPLTELQLLQRCIAPTIEPTLSLAQFEYLDSMKEMLLDYLSLVIKQRKKGANILLYGLPGTGKTEFAVLLGKELGLQTYTMAYMDEDGDTLSGRRRLENCRLAQRLLSEKQGLIIFDEVEDVFSSSIFSTSVAQDHKAWVNQFLETNENPMIWISNSVNCIDNAYLRRFDLIFEMPNLSIKHKEKLIYELVGDKLSSEYIEHFAQVEALSPAVIQRGLSVCSQLSHNEQPEQFAERALKLFNQTLKAQGYKEIEPLKMTNNVAYSLDWINCDSDIHKISKGLKVRKQGRICCYGPPGTGKTAWANWLAKQLGMRVLLKQGSDLLSPYVGGCEQNIAKAFKQAQDNNMMLVFDEVDTFLFTRAEGQRSWEHSMVNEMLTQIERFEGLLVVSTNLMNGLDPAALRRFDLKLQFDYLTSSQRQAFSQQQAVRLGLNFTNDQLKEIEKLVLLTPGDFAAVERRHRFYPFEKVSDWIDALANECKLKQGKVTRRIGF